MGHREVFENIFLALLSFGCGGHIISTMCPLLHMRSLLGGEAPK